MSQLETDNEDLLEAAELQRGKLQRAEETLAREAEWLTKAEGARGGAAAAQRARGGARRAPGDLPFEGIELGSTPPLAFVTFNRFGDPRRYRGGSKGIK